MQFCDPSVAVAARRAGPDRLLADLNDFGYLFEALIVRDLRVFADGVDGTVQRYRDSNDLEIDAVVTAGDERWAAFEVKLGQDDIDMAASDLLAVGRKVDTSKVGEPATLAIISRPRNATSPRTAKFVDTFHVVHDTSQTNHPTAPSRARCARVGSESVWISRPVE